MPEYKLFRTQMAEGVKTDYHGAASALESAEPEGRYFLMKVKDYFGIGRYDWLRAKFPYNQLMERLTLDNQDIYGSSRLGVRQADSTMKALRIYGTTGGDTVADDTIYNTITASLDTSFFKRIIGNKRYELTNHLGNVMAVVTDLKKAVKDVGDTTKVGYYDAEITEAQEFYPYGAMLRRYILDSAQWYRYGNGGQEKDDELYGPGNAYQAEFWEYDARLGRRWNVDPKNKPLEGPYSCYYNNPNLFVDITGAIATQVIDAKGNIIFDDHQNDGNIYYTNVDKPLNIKSIEDVYKNVKDGLITQIYKNGHLAIPKPLAIPSNSLDPLLIGAITAYNILMEENFEKRLQQFHRALWNRLAKMDYHNGISQYGGSGDLYDEALNYTDHPFAPNDVTDLPFTFDQTFGTLNLNTAPSQDVLSVGAWHKSGNNLSVKSMGNFIYNISLNNNFHIANIYEILNIMSHEKYHVISALTIQSLHFKTHDEANDYFRTNFERKAYIFQTKHITFKLTTGTFQNSIWNEINKRQR